MTLLITDDVVMDTPVRPVEDRQTADARHEEQSPLERLVVLLALSYSNMPLFP